MQQEKKLLPQVKKAELSGQNSEHEQWSMAGKTKSFCKPGEVFERGDKEQNKPRKDT